MIVPIGKDTKTQRTAIDKLRRSEMFVRTWKGGDKTALLVHGLASSSTTWRKLAAYLQGLGYTVIAPDLRGHGFSPRRSSYSLEEWSQDILSLGIKPDLLIGHSAGGLIAANLYNDLGKPKTVLIDPVFRFPHLLPMKFLAQRIFTIVQFSMLIQSVKAFEGENRRDMAFVVQGLKLWDHCTSYALDWHRPVVKEFIARARNALVIRSEKSYISPRYLLPHSRTGRVVIESFVGVRHNIHWDAYDRLLESMHRHLGIGTPEQVLAEQERHDAYIAHELARDARADARKKASDKRIRSSLSPHVSQL